MCTDLHSYHRPFSLKQRTNHKAEGGEKGRGKEDGFDIVKDYSIMCYQCYIPAEICR